MEDLLAGGKVFSKLDLSTRVPAVEAGCRVTALCDCDHSQGNLSLLAYAIRGKQCSKYLPVEYGSDPAGFGSCHVLPR